MKAASLHSHPVLAAWEKSAVRNTKNQERKGVKVAPSAKVVLVW